MKKTLIFILSAIAVQSYAAVQWNCTTTLPDKYAPQGCSVTTVEPAPTIVFGVNIYECLSTNETAVQTCADGLKSKILANIDTNTTTLRYAQAGPSPGQNFYPKFIMKDNATGSDFTIMTNDPNGGGRGYTSASNYSSIPKNAVICARDTGGSLPVSVCPSGSYALKYKSDNTPDSFELVP